MSTFLIAHVPDGLGLKNVLQLVKGTWTQLVTLSISDCGLKAKAFLLLSQASLDVSGNCLDAKSMALLAKGNWPKLASIILSPTLGAVAIAHFSAANWPIKGLVTKDTPFSVEMAAEPADLRLPGLLALYLVRSDLTAAAVCKLARAEWPQLTHLTLDHVDLDVLLGQTRCKSSSLIHVIGYQCVNDEQSWGPLWACGQNVDMVKISKRPVQLTC